jgi:hypothetical protein
MVRLFLSVLATLVLTACQAPSGATMGGESRAELRAALVNSGVLSRDRQLIHLSKVGDLEIDGGKFPVVDIMELAPGAVTPRGLNRIIVLDPALKPVQRIEYTTERPLFCQENRLYLFGDLLIQNILPEGNVLTFTQQGRQVAVSKEDLNDLPLGTIKK